MFLQCLILVTVAIYPVCNKRVIKIILKAQFIHTDLNNQSVQTTLDFRILG